MLGPELGKLMPTCFGTLLVIVNIMLSYSLKREHTEVNGRMDSKKELCENNHENVG